MDLSMKLKEVIINKYSKDQVINKALKLGVS